MTLRDIAPGLEDLPSLEQAKELCIRTHGDLLNLQCSKRLIGWDKNFVNKALERQELLLETLNRMAGAGIPPVQDDLAQPASATPGEAA